MDEWAELNSLELKWKLDQSGTCESLRSRFDFMSQPANRRGRPKGTGIDDADRIQRLVEVLRVHPDLRPTTAIRRMGFSDPSTIRRLRDKYKAFVAGAGPVRRDSPTSAPVRGTEALPQLHASTLPN
jgi:hypothetical protein